jgi:hypothetical protein
MSDDSERCEICDELFRPSDERAEMYHPEDLSFSLIVHAQCGLSKGMHVA